MNTPKRGLGPTLYLWTAIAVAAIAVGFFSISAPESFAQTQPAANDDPKRYSQLLQSIYQFVYQNYVDKVDPKKLY